MDSASGKEYRIFGPPGTGKTTYLARQIKRAVSITGPESVVVASFTRAAAVEIGGRELPLPKDSVGTLHAFCWRALGRPKISESKELVLEWNKRAAEDERLQVSPDGKQMDDIHPPPRDGRKDELYQQYCRLRARMIPREAWGPYVKQFARRWEEFKVDTQSMDFTDLIEQAIERGGIGAPPSATVGFFDEVQDFSPLELKLVRMWSERFDRVVLAGDDDQCIYGFKGSVPDAFLDPPVDVAYKRVLPDSYRLPPPVKAFADRWIAGVSRRERKEYAPRDGVGTVTVLNACHDEADEIVADLGNYTAAGKTIMLLASCGYMLEQLLACMRSRGVLFHNPFRIAAGHWNPMRGGVERLRAFMTPRLNGIPWSWADLWRWIEFVDTRASGMKRGAKKVVRLLADDEVTAGVDVRAEDLRKVFDSGSEAGRTALSQLEPGQLSLAWLESVLLATGRNLLSYALRVAQERGPEELTRDPQVIIGTIHSVKGGEADVVYLFPDLSWRATLFWGGEIGGVEDRDSIRRVFYVGATRARETLVLCDPTDARCAVEMGS